MVFNRSTSDFLLVDGRLRLAGWAANALPRARFDKRAHSINQEDLIVAKLDRMGYGHKQAPLNFGNTLIMTDQGGRLLTILINDAKDNQAIGDQAYQINDRMFIR